MGAIKSYAGSWVDRTLKRWNGSAWVTATVYKWNGSVWEVIQSPIVKTTYNATGYETRAYNPSTKHYARSLVSSSMAKPTFIGNNSQIVNTGFVHFNWASMPTMGVPIGATVRGKAVKDSYSIGFYTLYAYLVYSSASLSDYIVGEMVRYNMNPGIDDVYNIFSNDLSLAEALMNAYQNGRYPYALHFSVEHTYDSPASYGVNLSEVSIELTYES